MADLIKFPDERRRSATTYQLHRFAPDGGVRGTVLVQARNDTDATRMAYGLTEGLRADLWLEGRFVNSFAAIDAPVAVSLRLLDDPAPAPKN